MPKVKAPLAKSDPTATWLKMPFCPCPNLSKATEKPIGIVSVDMPMISIFRSKSKRAERLLLLRYIDSGDP